MVKNNRFTISIVFLIMVMCLSLANVQSAFADDGVPPMDAPIATEEPIATETPAAVEEIIPPVEESPAEELLSEIPQNTDLVILDENGDLVPLASQEALDILVEADPIWCPASVLSPTAGANGCTTSQTITGLLALMRTNAGGAFSQDGKIFLEKPGGAGFTTSLILDNTAGSLDTSFNTLKNFNLTIIGGWNGGASTTVTGESNFGNNAFIKIGTNSAGNTWVGNITIQDINVNDNTSAANPSVAVYTSNGSVTLNDVDVDNADNSNAINVVVSGTGNVTMSGIDVTEGTDGSGINISATSGTIDLSDIDIQDQQDGNGVSITNTSGNISFNDVDVQNQEDGYTATITSTSGNISITNGSSFNGNNNNLGFFASTSGSITITGTNSTPITFTDAQGNGTGTNRNGATLSGSTVNLTYVTAEDNDLNGISISNAARVNLNNVTAENNGTDPSGPNNSLGSGVRVFGTGSTLVIVNSGVFRDNERYGIEVSNTLNNTIYVTANPNCGSGGSTNALGCTNVTTTFDNTAPVVTYSLTGTAGSNGWYTSNVTVNWNVTDAQSGIFTTCAPTILSTETSGVTATCTATNNAGLSTTVTTALIKIDKTAPVTTVAVLSGTAGSNGWYVSNVTVQTTGTDFSTPVSCTANQAFTAETAGTLVSGTCTNNAGLSSSSSLTVKIDKTAPTLNLPANMNAEATSSTGATVSYSASGSDTISSPVTVSCAPASGSVFGFGTTTVNCTGTNNAGLSTNGSFTITVQDTTAPTVTVPANITTEATNSTGAIVNFSASASDIIDGPLSATCLPASGSTFALGTTTVNCSATDAHNNTGSNSFTVTVQDTTDPIVTVPANITTEATSASGATVTFSASATDAIDGPLPTTCLPTSGSTFPLGTTTVNCSATDTNNNIGVDSFTITVQDTTAPVIAFHSDIFTNSPKLFGNAINYTAPAATDIVDGASTATCTPASGSGFPTGDTTVVCTAVDAHGNIAIPVVFTVHIEHVTIARRFDGLAGGIIPVTGGSFEITCPPASFTQDFEGYSVTFTNLCGDFQAVIEPAIGDGLPTNLPEGKSFLNGLSVLVLKDSSLIEPLPDNGKINVKFDLPNGTEADNVTILFWDGKKWVEMKGKSTGNSYEVTVANGGMFILVQK